eukprot:13603103-Ditylum_brightwellii.AAC.1
MPLVEEMDFLNKEVGILTFFSPHVLLDKTTAQVSAEKTVTIEDIVDMPMAKRSKTSSHPEITRTGTNSSKKGALDFTAALGTDAVTPGWDEQACKHASHDSKSNGRKNFGSFPFLCLNNTASDPIRDIEVSIKLSTTSAKHPKPGTMDNN